jgi:hypothetical protein
MVFLRPESLFLYFAVIIHYTKCFRTVKLLLKINNVSYFFIGIEHRKNNGIRQQILCGQKQNHWNTQQR